MVYLYTTWAGIESWFLRLSEYKDKTGHLRKDDEPVTAGDSYKWLWHGWPDDTVEFGTIHIANGEDNFSFSFGKAGDCNVKIFTEIDSKYEKTRKISITTLVGKKIYYESL